MSIKPLVGGSTGVSECASAAELSNPPAKMPPPWASPPLPPSLPSPSLEELVPAPPAPPIAQLLFTCELLTNTSADEVCVVVTMTGATSCVEETVSPAPRRVAAVAAVARLAAHSARAAGARYGAVAADIRAIERENPRGSVVGVVSSTRILLRIRPVRMPPPWASPPSPPSPPSVSLRLAPPVPPAPPLAQLPETLEESTDAETSRIDAAAVGAAADSAVAGCAQAGPAHAPAPPVAEFLFTQE